MHELSNVGENRKNVNITGKNVKKEASVKLFPSPNCVSGFTNGIVPNNVIATGPKKEANVFCCVGGLMCDRR